MEKFVIHRDFKGVFIPKEVWLCKELGAREKMLYALILSYETEYGCNVSNKQLAKDMDCSESTISKSIAKLKKAGFLSVISFDGRNRVVMTD